jgi:uncharacterized membrane protein
MIAIMGPMGAGMVSLPMLMLIAVGVVVGVIMTTTRSVDRSADWSTPRHPADHADQDPLAILRERYARGEVGHEEFERILDGLLRTEGATPGALRNGDPR